jgi:hypothetical protein
MSYKTSTTYNMNASMFIYFLGYRHCYGTRQNLFRSCSMLPNPDRCFPIESETVRRSRTRKSSKPFHSNVRRVVGIESVSPVLCRSRRTESDSASRRHSSSSGKIRVDKPRGVTIPISITPITVRLG